MFSQVYNPPYKRPGKGLLREIDMLDRLPYPLGSARVHDRPVPRHELGDDRSPVIEYKAAKPVIELCLAALTEPLGEVGDIDTVGEDGRRDELRMQCRCPLRLSGCKVANEKQNRDRSEREAEDCVQRESENEPGRPFSAGGASDAGLLGWRREQKRALRLAALLRVV